MIPAIDCYQILQIPFGAGKADITAAYRRLCKLYHPDLSQDPQTEELMKQINLAYYILEDDLRREAYNHTYAAQRRLFNREQRAQSAEFAAARRQEQDQRAQRAMTDYFSALLAGDYQEAYLLLSLHDRQYVTLPSFCKWRESVQKVFVMRDFSLRLGEPVPRMMLENGKTAPARKLYLNISEKNILTQAQDQYQIAKYVIQEQGVWRVFLGYRDLNEIAKMFETLSAEQEQGERDQQWQDYCRENCRELAMLSLDGLLKEARREIYRHKRYHQPLVISCWALREESGEPGRTPDLLECAAKTLKDSLRMVDIPAYIGDGVFVVVFVEMRRRYAALISERLGQKMQARIHDDLAQKVRLDYAYSSYTGGSLKTQIERLAAKIGK